MRSAFVHEATIELMPGADEAAPGGAVTVVLCGHWDHEGLCRWPHHTGVDSRSGQSVRVRTVFACAPEEESAVRQRIVTALDSGRLEVEPRLDRWTTLRQGASTLEPAEEALAARLVAT